MYLYNYVFICTLDIWVPRPSIVIKIYINTLRFYVSVCVSVSDGSGMLVGFRSLLSMVARDKTIVTGDLCTLI